MTVSSSGLGDSAMASKTSRSKGAETLTDLRQTAGAVAIGSNRMPSNLPSRASRPTRAEPYDRVHDHERVRRLLVLLCALACWHDCGAGGARRVTRRGSPTVGDATQVISVVGGWFVGEDGRLRRTAAGWQAIGTGIPAYIGANGWRRKPTTAK